MRRAYVQTIGAVALGCALVAAAPILHDTLGARVAFFADSILIPLCAAIGGLVAGTLIRSALGKPNWRGWVASAAFALVALLIAAPIGGFLLVVFFTDGFGEPGVLARLSAGLYGAVFAILYLMYSTSTSFGITAIAAHAVLVHLVARNARRSG